MAWSINTDTIDGVVREAMEAWQVPGAAVALVTPESVAHIGGYGTLLHGSGLPVTVDSVFALASVSKAFTTTAMAALKDEGLLSWDDPVRKYLPEFRLSDPLADAHVTLRDLVTHRTGVTRNDLLWYRSPWNREELIGKLATVAPSHSFRRLYSYNNLMYMVAGVAAGRAAGKSWEEAMQSRLFNPLGFTSASTSVRGIQSHADRARGHVKRKSGQIEEIPYLDFDNIGPAGSLNMSITDLARWARFQLGDGAWGEQRILSAESFKETHSPQMAIIPDVPTKRSPMCQYQVRQITTVETNSLRAG